MSVALVCVHLAMASGLFLFLRSSANVKLQHWLHPFPGHANPLAMLKLNNRSTATMILRTEFVDVSMTMVRYDTIPHRRQHVETLRTREDICRIASMNLTTQLSKCGHQPVCIYTYIENMVPRTDNNIATYAWHGGTCIAAPLANVWCYFGMLGSWGEQALTGWEPVDATAELSGPFFCVCPGRPYCGKYLWLYTKLSFYLL